MRDKSPAADTAAKTAETILRAAIVPLGAAAWLACFALLARRGTWTAFAVAGPALAALALAFDREARALLRPSPGGIAAGLFAGAGMIAATHAAYAVLSALWPEIRPATLRLYGILNVAGFTPAERATLIVIVAASEEIVFRGALLSPRGIPGEGRVLHPVSRNDLARVAALAACYAFSSLTLGSALLVGCSFACGMAWGAVRIATRSLTAPIAAHIAWDMGVLIVWTLV